MLHGISISDGHLIVFKSVKVNSHAIWSSNGILTAVSFTDTASVVIDDRDVLIQNIASVVDLKLDIEFEYSAPCDRCGVAASNKHTVTILKSLATSLERQESDTIIVVPDMQLEVDELVYTEVVLNLPSKHLCKEDCKGLCYKCGKNLNEGDCDCENSEPDPRFEKLRELLNN